MGDTSYYTNTKKINGFDVSPDGRVEKDGQRMLFQGEHVYYNPKTETFHATVRGRTYNVNPVDFQPSTFTRTRNRQQEAYNAQKLADRTAYRMGTMS